MELGTITRMPETRDEIQERALRLDLALAHAGLNATALASALGITSASLSEIKKGKSKAPERWRQIADKLGVDVDWLMHSAGRAPAWAGSNVVYGIAISSRNDRSGLEDAVCVARTLYEHGAHGLVESLFFDTNLGHLVLQGKPGLRGSEKTDICEALSHVDRHTALVEFESEYYPDPNQHRSVAAEAGQDYSAAPPWAAQLLAEVKALRAEVAQLRGMTAPPVDTAPPLSSVEREEARRRIRHGRAETQKEHAPPPPRLVVLDDDDVVSTELDRILDPDEHPRAPSPTYPRPTGIPGEPTRGQ